MSDPETIDPLGYHLKKLILDGDLYRGARNGSMLTVEVRRRKNTGVHATFPGRWLCLTLWVWPEYEKHIMGPGLTVVEGQLTVTAAPARKEVWPQGVEACWLAQTLAYEAGKMFMLRTEFVVSYGGELARHEDPLVAYHKVERKFQDALGLPLGPAPLRYCCHCCKGYLQTLARCPHCAAHRQSGRVP